MHEVTDRLSKTASATNDFAAFRAKALRPAPLVVIGGAGYVGGVTAVGLSFLGHTVVGIDINGERLAQLRNGASPFHEPGFADLLQDCLADRRIEFDSPSRLADGLAAARLVFIAVNTPRRDDGEADLSDIINVASELGRHLRRHTVIVVKSTAPVGSQAILRRVLEQFGHQEGRDYDLVANPEFLREGTAMRDFFYPDRVVVGGSSLSAVQVVSELFAPLGAPILETMFEDALMIKYAANAFLATRVSFINEIANICERVGADVDVVANGLGFDKRIGHAYLRAGIGFSGPCLPKDLEGLIRLAEGAGYDPYLLKAVLEKNEHQRRQILSKVYGLLGTSLYGRKIGVMGLVFKAGTDDLRNSAAPVLVDYLHRRGAEIVAYDPTIRADMGLSARLVSSPYDAVDGTDLLLLLTAWPEFTELDYQRVRQLMRNANVVDGVNVLKPTAMRQLGFTYLSVGRP